MVAILNAFNPVMATRMQTDRLSRTANVGKIFVNKKRAVFPVERPLPAHKMFDLFDPAGMIDQILKWRSAFVNLLQIGPVIVFKRMAVNIPYPLFFFDGQHGVDGRVAGSYFLRRQSIF